MTKEFIAHEAGNDETWICLCGNQPGSDGFYPCNAQGEELEPIFGAGWENLYLCSRCRRIIESNTLEVVGRCYNSNQPDQTPLAA